ncbi:MAG: protein phosphatase 2C domain-containing protein [Clostridia bacterium]|nr:protein phosphatase 2C domain-containing protein [Clostridia bacterium]
MIHKFSEKNGCKFIICSDTGENHVSTGADNQDSALYGVISEDCQFIAVADGVSSVKYGREGSQAAVQSVKWLAEQIDLGFVDIRDENNIRISYVLNWKSNFEGNWDDYASTINFVIIKGSDLLVGQIGDGLILVDTEKEKHIYGESEDFYSCETYALGRAVIKSSFILELLSGISNSVAVMMSDGIGKEIEPDQRVEMLGYISELARSDNSAKEIEEWISELSERNGDDKTIGIMVGRD